MTEPFVDAARYPGAARYLAELPRGVGSHPDCRVKGSLLRSMLESTPVPFDREGLSKAALSLLDSPPLPNAWMQEVAFNALMLAHEDRMSGARFSDWVYGRNRKLFESSLYRVLFLVVSPERLLVGMTHRWSAFRSGSELRLLERSAHAARVELRYPERLHDERTLSNIAVAVRAAIDAAGAKRSTTKLELVEPTLAVLGMRWE
jgi:hypothetical protein